MSAWFSKRNLILITFISILLPTIAFAQTDPKGAFYAPPGTDGILFYYKHITGHEGFVDGEKLSKDNSLTADISMWRYVHYGKIGAFPWSFNVIIPFGSQTMEKGTFRQTSTGLGDPVLVGSVWFVDRPQDHFFVEFTGYITAPWGDYHNDQVVNLGRNQWAFKPELGIAWKPLDKLSLELLASYELYTDNDDYSVRGLTLKRDPVFSAWTHVTYDINKSLFLAGSVFWTKGGETEIDGISSNNEVETTTGMFTTGIYFAPNIQLLLQYKHDISVENGTGTDTVQFRLGYFW